MEAIIFLVEMVVLGVFFLMVCCAGIYALMVKPTPTSKKHRRM